MASACVISPLSAFLSTNLNNKIDTYDRLGDRVKRALGYPLVSVEVHSDQMNENIIDIIFDSHDGLSSIRS